MDGKLTGSFPGLAAVLLSFSLALAACDTGGCGGGGTGPGATSVDRTDYTSSYDYVFQVRNTTSKRLVAFKSEPRPENLPGGIPANANQHGLKKNHALFTSSGDFPLVLITEEQYDANKDNLIALKDTPFTRVWAFYNAGSVNETVYEISGKPGGSNKPVIQNGTAMNVELRLDGIMGDTVGYAAQGMYNTTIYMIAGDYLLFPVFKKYNSVRNEVITGVSETAERQRRHVHTDCV